MSKKDFAMSAPVRVRFAPSPTGFMHLGNVRAALFNYLFAQQKQGAFILRIEDTDQSRHVNEAVEKIIEDLAWLGLTYQEGPVHGGPFGPYAQSERAALYEQHLMELVKNGKAYRCFCTLEELEEKRARQIALKKPPRYDRTCLHLSDDMIKSKIAAGIPFIWRLQINNEMVIEVKTLERGTMTFDMQHFSDFALTRADGSVTFMFANFVDDWLMRISHVIRGEDHLTNTAMQGALYDAFVVPMPVFWHLPLLSNEEGKKLSKRDFGFSLDDLRSAGYLPEAICNYLATVGASFSQEIQSLDELASNVDFERLHTTGAIRYDLHKLLWMNHQWIMRVSNEMLIDYVRPFLYADLPQSNDLSEQELSKLIEGVKADAKTLQDFPGLLNFYFEAPQTRLEDIVDRLGMEKAQAVCRLLTDKQNLLNDHDAWMIALKAGAKSVGLAQSELWGTVRYLLTGSFQGPKIHDLLALLDDSAIFERLRMNH